MNSRKANYGQTFDFSTTVFLYISKWRKQDFVIVYEAFLYEVWREDIMLDILEEPAIFGF